MKKFHHRDTEDTELTANEHELTRIKDDDGASDSDGHSSIARTKTPGDTKTFHFPGASALASQTSKRVRSCAFAVGFICVYLCSSALALCPLCLCGE
jgi:hypothetical protein